MIDAQLLSEDSLQAGRQLRGQYNLGQEVQHLLSTLQGFCDEVTIDLCLATGGYTVEQTHGMLFP